MLDGLLLDAAAMKELLSKMARPAVKRTSMTHLRARMRCVCSSNCFLVSIFTSFTVD